MEFVKYEGLIEKKKVQWRSQMASTLNAEVMATYCLSASLPSYLLTYQAAGRPTYRPTNRPTKVIDKWLVALKMLYRVKSSPAFLCYLRVLCLLLDTK